MRNEQIIARDFANVTGAKSVSVQTSPTSEQRKTSNGDTCVLGIHKQLEAQFLAHLQHCLVFLQRSSFDDPQPHTPHIFNYQPHKHPTQSVTFKVRAHSDREFTRFAIGLRVQPHDTYHFAAGFLDSDERHRSPIIDVNQSVEVGAAQFLFRTKEAQTRVILAHAFREISKITHHRRAAPAGQKCVFHPEAEGAVPILSDTLCFHHPDDMDYA
jgi:hypothetical protein